MATIPQQQTIVQYVANASQFQYTFAFYAPEPTDIQVFYQAPNATPIPSADQLVYNTDYTVTYNSDPTTGGYITLLFTPTTGNYLTINLMIQASLTTNFASAQTFNGANLDTALDRLLMLCQQNQNYALNRNLSYVINTYLPNAIPYTQLPPLPQNFIWIGSGAGVVAAQISTVPSANVLQSMLANNSPGTDGSRLVGYYDTPTSTPTTVQNYLSTILGQKISSQILTNAPVSLTSTQTKNITFITLPPGNWNVWANYQITCNDNAGITSCFGWSSLVNATKPDTSYVSGIDTTGGTGLTTVNLAVPYQYYSISVPTVIYLSVVATFNAGNSTACGGIWATRT